MKFEGTAYVFNADPINWRGPVDQFVCTVNNLRICNGKYMGKEIRMMIYEGLNEAINKKPVIP